MQQTQAIFGGEGNGGPIDPQVGYIRDSFVGMAWTLHAMAARELTISQLADELPRYEICKTKQQVAPQAIPAALSALEKHFADAESDRMDGLRLDWPGKWLLIRASNTEPIVRIVAETPSAAESRSLCDEAAGVIASV
jgi:phosphomannomutase